MKEKISKEYVEAFVKEFECSLIGEYVNSTTKTEFRCKCGKIFTTTFSKFKDRNKRQCDKCGIINRGNANMLTIQDVRDLCVDKGVELISDKYCGCESNLDVKCSCGEVFNIRYSSIKASKKALKCKKCRYDNSPRTEFKFKIGEIVNDSLKITDFKRMRGRDNNLYKKYKYKCLKCGFNCGEHYYNGIYSEEYWVMESNIKKYGCPCCSQSKMVVEGINNLGHTSPWMMQFIYDYEDSLKYTQTSNKKIKVICPNCGKIKNNKVVISSIYMSKTIDCECSDNIKYPNKFMSNILNQLGVEYIREYSPTWIKPRRYDFYVPSKKLIIEMDGGLGHGNRVIGDYKSIEQTRDIDIYKDKEAFKNGISVIRINCDYNGDKFEFITNNIQKSELKSEFDLDVVNFEQCDKECSRNDAKYICQLWEGCREKMTINDMIKHYNIRYGRTYIYNCIQRGVKYNWCSYDSGVEMKKSAKKNCINIDVYDSKNNYLKTFETSKEIEINSLNCFGVYLSQVCIDRRCDRRQNLYGKIYKGYYFKRSKDI